MEPRQPFANIQDRLPPPPPGKIGWPWTKAYSKDNTYIDNGRTWPLVSIVTPSYNQVGFIEATIRSVLLQGYPNLEYIIIDGGSTDGSVEVIRRYEPWLTYWASEPDRGQGHAINKGFQRSRGEIMAYLNSDDMYHPQAVQTAVNGLIESEADILIGAVDLFRSGTEGIQNFQKMLPSDGPEIHFFPIFSNGRSETLRFLQPGTFWRRSLWERTGQLDECYHYILDREWFTRALARDARVITSNQALAVFSLHAGSKTQENEPQFLIERARMYWQLSNSDDFCKVPCWLESLRWALQYQQDVAYAAYAQLSHGEHPVKAYFVLLAARIVRRIRMAMDRLAKYQKKRRNGSV